LAYQGGQSWSIVIKIHLQLRRAVALFLSLLPFALFANVPGGGTGTGPNVTLTENSTNVTLANGIVSIRIGKTSAVVDQINYTFNNNGSSQTLNLLAGGNNGGQLYWEFGGFGSGLSTYSVVSNSADYAEVSILFDSAANGAVDIHFSLPRGATGFYVTPIYLHRNGDNAMSMGECRDNIYASSIFNWMSTDATRNRLMAVNPSYNAVGVQTAPVECSMWTNGIYAGQYEDKYKYTADFGDLRVWGWSSVGTGGKNIGLWDVAASVEYYPGGPMKRELFCHIGTTILNVTHGAHYGGGTDSSYGANEEWSHVYGPHFIYCNAISNNITATNTAAQALYNDALAQSVAEAGAWPYAWFNNAYYTPESGRGTVKGQIVINDSFNPNASASNLWVGVEQQPSQPTTTYDFQKWSKPYQFWVRTDANGNFTIPDVITGANYTLYAFGPGAAGTFQSQSQTGGNAPNELNFPSPQFSVTVTAGATNDLGTVTWTPNRVGPTVFEIGYPDRTSAKFRHGDDWWVGDIGPAPTNPMPVWSKFLEYPFDFPTGPSYTVGSSRWQTDGNFCQPPVLDAAGNINPSTSTITFNLPSAPASNGSLYLALSSDYLCPIIINVNGNLITSSTGYSPSYSGSGDGSNATIREGIHGVFSDSRISVPSGYLHAGLNTITISIRLAGGASLSHNAMYDYVRLELPGYIPPAPSSATAYAGNGRNLISWPVQSGATSYNVLRSTTSGSGYVAVTNGIVGPVCGSGPNNATWLDTAAVNGTTYYYVVQSVNPSGTSTNSPQSAGTTPSAAISSSAPAAPASVTISGVAHHSATVNWAASVGANFYTVYRSTLVDNGGGSSNVLGTVVLNNTNTSLSFTDTAVTDGTTYGYYVTAASAGGTSGNSLTAVAKPIPAPPSSAPGTFTGLFNSTSIVLNWSSVPEAIGYIIRRATNSSGPFVYVQNITPTKFTDSGLDPSLTYYYQVAAVNAAGVSTNSSATVVPPPTPPISLSAFPGNAQVLLSWTAVPGVTGYYLYSGTASGDETNLLAADLSGTMFTNTGLINGTTYYYVVASTNASSLGPNSPEADATPSASIIFAPRNLIWAGDGAANIWDASGVANCQTNSVRTKFINGDTLTFDSTGSNNVPIVVAGTPLPALTVFNATKNYTLNGPGSIAGTNVLLKTGSGTLTLNNTNTYTGGTIISNSTVLTGNGDASTVAWGKGTITLLGGTIQFFGYGTRDTTTISWGGCTNTINVPAGQSGTLQLPARFGYFSAFNSPLIGGGTLNVTVEYVRDYLGGDWSAFTGKINVSVPNTGYYANQASDFRINNSKGYSNAAIYLNNLVNLYNINANDQTNDIGELGGSATAFIGAGSASSSNPTWRVGAKNTTNTFAGTIADSGVTSLIKTGTGMLVLSGANTYSGNTTINGGTLVVSNLDGSATGTGAVAVNSTGKLSGNGTIAGPVTVNSGGTFTPGNAFDALTISNNLTLAAGSTTLMKVQHTPMTNSSVNVSGLLTLGGTLNVTNLGGAFAGGDTFKLFNAASYTGSFTTLNLPPLSGGLAWQTGALTSSGTLSVVVLPSPYFQSVSLVGNGIRMAGSGGTPSTSFYLLGATNVTTPLANWTRLQTNQFDGSGNFLITNSINAGTPVQLYRLQLP
jgi:rhamnogalacturonan endolyase